MEFFNNLLTSADNMTVGQFVIIGAFVVSFFGYVIVKAATYKPTKNPA